MHTVVWGWEGGEVAWLLDGMRGRQRRSFKRSVKNWVAGKVLARAHARLMAEFWSDDDETLDGELNFDDQVDEEFTVRFSSRYGPCPRGVIYAFTAYVNRWVPARPLGRLPSGPVPPAEPVVYVRLVSASAGMAEED